MVEQNGRRPNFRSEMHRMVHERAQRSASRAIDQINSREKLERQWLKL
jgi:hypothetical protein